MKLRQVVTRNLRILRKQRGLTQEALADQVEINRNYVGQIEREEKSPTIDMIEKLANALSVDATAFFTRPQRRRP
jgi:transcriptional regulator with XRE-family HTH domain